MSINLFANIKTRSFGFQGLLTIISEGESGALKKKTRIKAKSKGSAQDNMNLATFENEMFPFPSLNEQHEIVVNLNKLSAEIIKLEIIYQRKLNVLVELKQSLLQKAFSGELTKDAILTKKEAAA